MAVAEVPVADAYLDWARATRFRLIESVASDRPGVVRRVGLLVRWSRSTTVDAAARISADHGASVPEVYRAPSSGERMTWTIRVPCSKLEDFLKRAELERVDLASPISGDGGEPDPVHAFHAAPTGAKWTEPAVARARKLVVVLDDGCPFAHPVLQRPDKDKVDLRLLWLWNQDPDAPAGAPLNDTDGPSPSCNFGYGRQFSGTGLAELLRETEGRAEAAYARTGLAGLRRAAVHGACVLDLLLTELPEGADADVVFVQFPRDAVDDPTGRWLPLAVLDGLHYALAAAGTRFSHVVACISWGPQTGPHDGGSLLEQAMDDLIEAWRREGRTLDICLPAGNSFGARAHAQFELSAGGSVNWVVPPDGDAPAFLEVWWPEPMRPEQARLYVTPPGGARRRVPARAVLHGGNAWFSQIKRVGRCTMALLVVHPTSGKPGLPVGRHGVWRIEVPALDMQQTPAEQGGTDRRVHVYVARADHNLGARRRARASHLEDEDAGRGRFLAQAQRFDEVPGSAIRRQGTLSGIATGMSTRVAGGHRWKDGNSADYSSSGPTRGMRLSPDRSCVTDRSAVLKGLLANGVRAGTKVRIVGTSAAAPQLGRHLLLQGPPPVARGAVGQAVSTTTEEAPSPDLRQGRGRLSPAPGRLRRR